MKPSTSIRSRNSSPKEGESAIPELFSPTGFVVAATCVAAVLAIVYAPSLNFTFILDDHRFTGDARIQFSGHIWEYFTSFVWAQFTGGPPSFYRPMFLLWMRLNYILCDLSTWGWHLLSVIKHGAVAVLLGCLVWKLLRNRSAALLAAALFALHPAQAESVAWVTVPDPLMAAGVLGSLLLYLKYLSGGGSNDERELRHSRTRKKVIDAPSFTPLFGASFLCFVALGAKETAIVLPAVVFALSAGTKPIRLKQKPDSKNKQELHIRFRRALFETAPFASATVLYLLLRFFALGSLSSRTQHLPLATVVFSWPATLWFYVKVLFWPVQSRAFADPTVVSQFSFRSVLLPFLGLLFTAALLGILISWCRRNSLNLSAERSTNVIRALVTGVMLLVVPILPALDLNALNPGDFLHGRYAYLSIAGLMILLSTGWHLSGKYRVGLMFLAATLAVASAVLTFVQEKQWRDDLTVFTTAHSLAPNNRPVAQNLANAHVQQALQLGEEGRCDDAVPVFEQVTGEFPNDWYAWASLGECLVQLNNLPQAEESLHKAADLSHDERVIQRWQEVRSEMRLPSAPAIPK